MTGNSFYPEVWIVTKTGGFRVNLVSVKNAVSRGKLKIEETLFSVTKATKHWKCLPYIRQSKSLEGNSEGMRVRKG